MVNFEDERLVIRIEGNYFNIWVNFEWKSLVCCLWCDEMVFLGVVVCFGVFLKCKYL